MTDEDRINWLGELAKNSRTGLSIEHVKGEGFRLMTFHRLDCFHTDLRRAIDEGIALRQGPPAPPPGAAS